MGVLNMNHEKNKLYQTAALQPLITTPVFFCRSFLVSQTLTSLLEVIAPLSLSTAFRNKKLWGCNPPGASERKCFRVSFS